ncbi:Uncharacterized protein GBIM_15131 [Gryllus bimaculatus]|nr:Uncharacterized protein GBIM_15131 [Gryllus bimaculatus]
MSKILDIESEDCFYENLTLGVVHILERTPRVSKIELERLAPCDRLVLTTWEQRHCCTMPEDLRNFYCSTDGFRLTWNYEFAGEVHPTGKMHINSVSDLRRLAGIKCAGDMDFPTLLDIEICNQQESATPNFGVRCKIFELDPCDGMAKVCLVYMDHGDSPDTRMREDPTIWLLDRCFEWHFLANTFTLYFRMMLVHQGLPQWQFRFTPMGLTPWAEVENQTFNCIFIFLMEQLFQ